MFDGHAICDLQDTLAPLTDGEPECGASGWSVLNVIPRCHALVCRLLEHYDIQSVDFTYECRKPRRAPVHLPYFPSYVFVRLAPQIDWRSITRWPGAIRFLGDQLSPRIVTLAEMATLVEACPPVPEPVTIRPPRYGDTLRVVIGHYRGSIGTCFHIKRNRLWMQIGDYRVELPKDHVEIL